jgi:hypothetical protein
MTLVAAALATLSLSSVARAEGTANEFIRKIDDGDRLSLLVLGSYGTGITAANAYVLSEKGAPIFCPPQRLAITNEQYVQMLRDLLKAIPKFGDYPVTVALLFASKRAFPC